MSLVPATMLWLYRPKNVAMNPWLEVPGSPPFIAPADERYVDAFNASDGRHPEHEIDTRLLPEPWLGRHDAPVVMLTPNPGFDPSDVAFHARRDFAQANRANLTWTCRPWRSLWRPAART